MEKTAIVTGAAKRLGRMIVIWLAEHGYDIGLHYCDSDADAFDVQNVIKSKGRRCEVFKANFHSAASTLQFAQNVRRTFAHIDLMINSAAVFDRLTIADTSDKQFDKILSVNLKAPFCLIRELAPICDDGLIINIIDAKTFCPDNRYAAYLLAKNALDYLTKLAAQEFAPKTRVNGIAPGLLLPSAKNADFERFSDKIPLHNSIQPEYLLKTIDYLIQNKYITGQTITLDGGYYARRSQ